MRSHRFLAWLLPLLLLGAQCLALAHGLLHTHGAAGQVASALQVGDGSANAVASFDEPSDTANGANAANAADTIFGHHHHAHACQLYAHWAGGDAAWPSVLALAWAVSDAPVRLADKQYRDWLAPFVVHFSARAPPLRVGVLSS